MFIDFIFAAVSCRRIRHQLHIHALPPPEYSDMRYAAFIKTPKYSIAVCWHVTIMAEAN